MSTSSKRGRRRISKEVKESNEEEIWCGAFPDDVVVEILSRLPPKPFFRFKCVSKLWLSLSSHAFRLNKLLQPTLLGFFYETSPKSKPKYQIDFTYISGGLSGGVYDIDPTLSALRRHDLFEIKDCCNGLLLIKGLIFGRSNISQHMYVHNPATRKHITFRLLPEKNYQDETFYEMFSLAFDPQDKSHFHVVCFRQWHNAGVSNNIFLTFSVDSGRWQKGGNLGSSLKIARTAKGTFLDGKVHRVTEGHEIVSIDPKNNTHLVTKFDFPCLSENGISEVGQSQGLLHFMFVNKFDTISIWVPKEGDLQKWVLKYQLSELVYFDYLSFGNIKLHPQKDILYVHCENACVQSINLNTGEPNAECYLSYPAFASLWLYMPCFVV